jgi:ADP-heptose:LPS heptosyltransferase
MGDLLMSTPALHALKETFRCKITLLTSSMAAGIAKYITPVDAVLVYNVPWVKHDVASPPDNFLQLVQLLKQQQFDAVIVFTVCTQNPMPAIMLAYLAGIPRRLAYCRENPYQLLTHWVPDEEPYTMIRHQVQRDLHLVNSIGAYTTHTKLSASFPSNAWKSAVRKLRQNGVETAAPWLILHPGVSEAKREFPVSSWIKIGRQLIYSGHYQLLLTGTVNEAPLLTSIQKGIGAGVFNLAGLLNLEEFMCLIKEAPLVISVNTGTVHIAAAAGTPVIVLYACTNPQHTPWRVASTIFYYAIPESMQSKNEVVRYTSRYFKETDINTITPEQVVKAAQSLLSTSSYPEATVW